MFITFIFKLPNNPGQTLYGKYYTDYIYDDHEGLDKEIKHYLLKGINEFQNLKLSQEVENVHITINSNSVFSSSIFFIKTFCIFHYIYYNENLFNLLILMHDLCHKFWGV